MNPVTMFSRWRAWRQRRKDAKMLRAFFGGLRDLTSGNK